MYTPEELLVEIVDAGEVQALPRGRCWEHSPSVPVKCRPHYATSLELEVELASSQEE